MAIELGTRQKQNFRYGHPASQREDRVHSRDVGMSKNVTASMTFTASNGRATAAASTFAAFAVGDPVLVSGTNLNNGTFQVLSTDASTFVQLDVPVKDEGPLSATMRTT